MNDSTALTTFATVKPNSLNSTPAGADSPKRSRPMTLPSRPTYFHQPSVTPASTATRGRPLRQHAVLVGLVLAVEDVGAGHRDDAHRDVFLGQRGLGLEGQLDFGAGGDDDGLGLRPWLRRSRSRPCGCWRWWRRRGRRRAGSGATGQSELGPVRFSTRASPGDHGFDRVAGTPDIHVRDHAQGGGSARPAGASGRLRRGRWSRG